MRLFTAEKSNHTALLVVVRMYVDAGQCAQCGVCAIGGDGQTRIQHHVIIQAHAHAGGVLLQRLDFGGAMHAHASAAQGLPQHVHQQAVFDDPAQLRLPQCIGIKGQWRTAGGVPHAHAAIGLHTRGLHLRPHPQIAQ